MRPSRRFRFWLRRPRDLATELRAEADTESQITGMTDHGDPKLQGIAGSRVGWQGLTSRPVETEWRGD